MDLALFGLHRGPGIEPETLARRARAAEDAGLESLWVGDHVAPPVRAGKDDRLEAVVAVGFLAAVTSRVRLAIGVVVLPQRHPVLLAKQLSSLDILTGGRLTVGVGAGYVEEELAAFGVPLTERGARTDDYLATVRAIWRGETSHEGRFVSYEGVAQSPSPVQRPHPPIVVGGHSPAALNRAARQGNGWFGWDLDLADTGVMLASLRRAVRTEERPARLGVLEITVAPKERLRLDVARRFADLGVHRLVLRARPGETFEKLIAGAGDALVGRV
jgi:probable F420-dependent oxidoreductase